MGPSPITFPDIAAWCQLHRRRLTPWEVDTIKDLDAVYLRVQANAARAARSRAGQPKS